MTKLDFYKDAIKNCNILSVQINLLNNCTSRCIYCRKYTWPKDIIPYGKLLEAITYLKEQGLKSICFSGGDPILYPKIVDVLKFCKNLHIKTSLITTLISTNKFQLADIAKLATRIHCSVDSTKNDVYSYLRGVDQLPLVKENLIYVNDIRSKLKIKPVRISSTISNINVDEIENLYNFAKETGSTINYYFVHQYKEFALDNCMDKFKLNMLEVLSEDCVNKISNANSIISNEFTNDYEKIACNCKIPYIHCLINANGDIYPCCKLLNDNGEYKDQSREAYGNILKDNLDLQFKMRFSKLYSPQICQGCEERYIPLIEELDKIFREDEGELFL